MLRNLKPFVKHVRGGSDILFAVHGFLHTKSVSVNITDGPDSD